MFEEIRRRRMLPAFCACADNAQVRRLLALMPVGKLLAGRQA
jgi:hypothetical protein